MSRLDSRLNAVTPTVLSLFRIVVGLLFICHATQKLLGWPTGPRVPVGTWPFWWAGIIEIVCGVLITIGLFTRPAAFIVCGEMAFAYFTQHLPKDFWPLVNGGELAVLYCSASLLLVFAGPGGMAVDSVLGRRPRTDVAAVETVERG